MRLLETLILVLTTSFCLGQETKFVSKNGSGFIEEYYVLKTDKNLRHGTYVKYRQPFGQIVVIESGSYSNGVKHGLWEEFYNEVSRKTWNAIKEKGQYVNGKKNGVWTYYHLDTTTNITNLEKIGQKRTESVNVNIDNRDAKLRMAGMYLNDKRVGEWTSWNRDGEVIQKFNFTTGQLDFENSIEDSTLWNTNRKPVFIGGLPSLSYYLASNIRMAHTAFKVNQDSIYAIITFNIDQDGKTNSIQVTDNSGHKDLKDELIRLISSTDTQWIPGLRNGLKSEYPYKLRYDIIRIEFTPNSRQWRSYFSVIE